MIQDWLDKNLGDKLDNYDSPMDLENAWESLQAKRQAPKKKNRFFFFWVIFGLIAIGAVGSYFLLNNISENNYNAEANLITETDNISKNENPHFEKTELSSPTLSNAKNVNQHNADTNIATETKTILNTSKNITVESQDITTQKETKSIVNTNTPFPKTKNNNVITSNTNSSFPKKPNANFIFPKQNKIENIVASDSTIFPKTVQPMAVRFLPSLEMSLLDLPQNENSILEIYTKQKPISYQPVPVRIILSSSYFGVTAGYGIRSRGKILSQENPLDVITINAFYEDRFGYSKLYFKTGITLDQFVNSIESTSEQLLSQPRDNQLIAVNHFQNGTTEDVFGTAEVSEIEKTFSKNYNRYQLISIPIILGYDVISSNTASLQIEGGIARSIFGFHSGKYFDLVDSDFEKRGVWQGIYGLNFNFRTSSRSNIFTSLKGNYHFNTIGKSDQLDIEKFRFHQIQVGLRFKL